MIEYKFNLHLSREEFLQYYEGVVKFIQVKSYCGKIIQFPADKMREFVLKDGVHGSFVIQLNDDDKFLALKRI